jgi:hypothetical protein
MIEEKIMEYIQLELPLVFNDDVEFIKVQNQNLSLPEKVYQKDLVYLLNKTTEYLGWQVFTEYRVHPSLGQKRFIDIVIKRKNKQPIIIELKKGIISIEIIQATLDKDYLNGYQKKFKRFPLLFIIGRDVVSNSKKYCVNTSKQFTKIYSQLKYKPQVWPRTYFDLTQFIETELLKGGMDKWDLSRIKKDCSLLYGVACKELAG